MNSGTILVVDDTPANLEVIVETLSAVGYTVWAVTSGQRALKQLQTHIPDLILLDIQMPEMDGFVTCKMIKANANTAEIPIIFITALSDTENIVKGLSLGAVDYISKPFRELELLARIQTHLKLQTLTHQLKEQVQQAELSRQLAEGAKRDAEVANQAKSEFLATMSHELRTPLNAILGFAENLQDRIFGELNDDQLKAIATIESSSYHLLSLIKDILDLAKIDAGKLDLAPVPTDFEEFCQECIQFIHPLAHNQHIQLLAEITPYPKRINIDPLRVRQILINLLSNAVKFTPSGGQISFKAKVHEHSSSIEFHVIDTGIGIAPTDLPKLFQAFVQLDSRLNRQYEGTGLGLSLVKRLVDLQKGHIYVESVPNEGSSFRVCLPYELNSADLRSAQPVLTGPLVEDQQRQTLNPGVYVGSSSRRPTIASDRTSMPVKSPRCVQRPKSLATSQGLLILLAEDHQSNIETFVSYLTYHKHRVIVAKDGIEAIDLTKQQHPDVILMDIHMPIMDGITAIRHIRKMPDIATIPIIALTALAMPGDKEKCLEIGADRYLSKPVKLKQLHDTIGELFCERRAIAEVNNQDIGS